MNMTAERRRPNRVFDIIVTVGLALIGFMAVTSWNTKADVSSLQAMDVRHTEMIKGHIQGDRLIQLQDSLWKVNENEILLELLCREYPNSHRCKVPKP